MRRSLLFVALAVACVCVHQAHATCSIASRPDNTQATEYVLSNTDKAAIVERHNWYKVHTPEAVDDMQLYQWDSALEATARVWAKKCYWGHSENSCRTNVANFSNTGENLASGYGSPYEPTANPSGQVRMVENWAGERAYYHWVGNTCDSGQVCGHYTQMVWHDSNHIGCSMMKCPAGTVFSNSPAWYLVCHYGKAGNYYGQAPGHIATGNPCAENRNVTSGASRCGEFGICVMSGGNFHCECEDGYYSPGNTGACVPGTGNGAQGSDVCHPASGADPCSGHGVCTKDALTIEGYRCICTTGYEGLHCEEFIGACSENPCIRGTCSSTDTSTYVCNCTGTGYTGPQCNTLPAPPATPAPTKPAPLAPAKPAPLAPVAPPTRPSTRPSSPAPVAAPTKPAPLAPVAAPTKPAPQAPPAAPVLPANYATSFMGNLFDLINADRKASNYAPVEWSTSLVGSASAEANKCPNVTSPSFVAPQGEGLILICGYGGEAASLDRDFAGLVLSIWRGSGAWWAPNDVARIGCAITQGNICSGTANLCGSEYKPLICAYETVPKPPSPAKEEEEAFKASTGHPMLYGHAELEGQGALAIHFNQQQQGEGRSVYAYAAIAAAGVVVAAAAVGLLAVAARRRRAAAGQQAEYAELMVEDQLA